MQHWENASHAETLLIAMRWLNIKKILLQIQCVSQVNLGACDGQIQVSREAEV